MVVGSKGEPVASSTCGIGKRRMWMQHNTGSDQMQGLKTQLASWGGEGEDSQQG